MNDGQGSLELSGIFRQHIHINPQDHDRQFGSQSVRDLFVSDESFQDDTDNQSALLYD